MHAADRYDATPSRETLEALVHSQRWASGWFKGSLVSVPVWLLVAWQCRRCATAIWGTLAAIGLVGMPALAWWQRAVVLRIQGLRDDTDIIGPLIFYELHEALQDPDRDLRAWAADLNGAVSRVFSPNEAAVSWISLYPDAATITLYSGLSLTRCPYQVIADTVAAATRRTLAIKGTWIPDGRVSSCAAIRYMEIMVRESGKQVLTEAGFVAHLRGLIANVQPASERVRDFLQGMVKADDLDALSYQLSSFGVYLLSDAKEPEVVFYANEQTLPLLDGFLGEVLARHIPVHVVITDAVEATMKPLPAGVTSCTQRGEEYLAVNEEDL
jgi:hypothetical protein